MGECCDNVAIIGGMSVLASRFQFAPSRWAAVLVAIGAGIAAGATLIIPLPLPLPLRWAAAGGVVWLFIRAGRQVAPLGIRAERAIAILKSTPCGLEFLDNGKVIVLGAQGAHLDLGEVVYRFVSPLLISVTIKGGNRRYHVLIMRDALPAHEHRQLRVQLNRQPH